MTQEALFKLNKSDETWINHTVVSNELESRELENNSIGELEEKKSENKDNNDKYSYNDFSGTWRLLLNKGYSYVDFTFYEQGYFNFSVYIGSQNRAYKTGEGSGKWSINGDQFFGIITNSNHYQFKKGHQWTDKVISMLDQEFRTFTNNGDVEIFKKVKNQ